MSFQVRLTRDASRDLKNIYNYIDRRNSSARAAGFLGEIEKLFERLSADPWQGCFPTELLDVGFREYREVSFKSYRIVYRVIEETVYVLAFTERHQDQLGLTQ